MNLGDKLLLGGKPLAVCHSNGFTGMELSVGRTEFGVGSIKLERLSKIHLSNNPTSKAQGTPWKRGQKDCISVSLILHAEKIKFPQRIQ